MPDKVRPIRPDEVENAREKTFPDAVFESFNQLIIKHFSRGSITIKQEDVVALMVEKGLNREEIFAKRWLDVERAYRSVGWKVSHDKPGYNESYPAIFIFDRLPKNDQAFDKGQLTY